MLHRDVSIRLSLCMLALFLLAVIALDVACPYLAGYLPSCTGMQSPALFMVTIYTGSVLGYGLIFALTRLLLSIAGGQIFTAESVRLLRASSWLCIGGGAVSLASGFYYLPFFAVAAAAFFVGLVVRVVKNAFEQAVAMKDELDLTV